MSTQQEFQLGPVQITLNKEGARQYQKISCPIRYGRFSEIRTRNHIFQFTLNGEPKFVQGTNGNWPHPSEWLKRTLGNDWVYYFSGGYTNVFDCLGEYYVPCFPYPSNSLWLRDPFQDREVREGLQALASLRKDVAQRVQSQRMPQEVHTFLSQVAANDPSRLWAKATRLFALLQERVSVLPPDARHVDYDVLPLVIADGCLYNCGFCSVKSNKGFTERDRDNIHKQLDGLRTILGPELQNYNALFLGQHDALNCRPELIEEAALTAYARLGMGQSLLKNPSLYLFGSVDSLNNAGLDVFSRLQSLPFCTYINIGLESAHQPTLDFIRKPIRREQVLEAYARMLEINATIPNVEITANMLMDWDLPAGHWQGLQELTQDVPKWVQTKGAVYLSPLSRRRAKDQIRTFQALKRRSKLPLFVYLIQRL